jgi:hypothetical protein
MQEVRAYAFVLLNESDNALECLWRVSRYEPRYSWEHELHGRASLMETLIRTSGLGPARQQLDEWRVQSLAALGIST